MAIALLRRVEPRIDRLQRLSAESPGIFGFGGGLPSSALFPRAALADAFLRVLAQPRCSALQYGWPEGQPAVLFKPADGAWDWSRTGKLVIPVENPGGEPVTLLLRVSDGAGRSLSGKISIAPDGAGDLTLWIDAPAPRQMGMIAGPSLTAAPGRSPCANATV